MEEKTICTGVRHSPKVFYISIASIAGLLILIPFVMAISAANRFPTMTVMACFLDNQLSIPFVVVAIGLLVFLGIFNKLTSQNEISVTDKRVFGQAAFGKRVDLPLDAISAVGTSAFKAISVSSASGVIKFYLMENQADLHKAISGLLVNRQTKDAAVAHTTIKQEIPQSNADELKKFKELLDSGIITQEEFDAKKKQLLGL